MSKAGGGPESEAAIGESAKGNEPPAAAGFEGGEVFCGGRGSTNEASPAPPPKSVSMVFMGSSTVPGNEKPPRPLSEPVPLSEPDFSRFSVCIMSAGLKKPLLCQASFSSLSGA